VNDTHTLATEAIRTAPPLSVAALTLCGITLDVWVQIGTLVYLALQAYFLLRDKWWRQRKK